MDKQVCLLLRRNGRTVTTKFELTFYDWRANMKPAGPALSVRVTNAIEFFFEGESRATVAALLLHQCGFGLPLAQSAELIERIRLAVLKLANGNADSLVEHLAAAQLDFRDVLVAADFGNDLTAHGKWVRALCS